MNIFIIAVSGGSQPLALRLARELPAVIIPRDDVSRRWSDADALIFICAMGICVRTIAPLVGDKHSDPAVVCVDGMGEHAISVLSGHVGGANTLTRHVSAILGAKAVITTLGDLKGTWALDTMAERFGWTMDKSDINSETALFVSGASTLLWINHDDEGTRWMLRHLPENVTAVSSPGEKEGELLIAVSPVAPKVDMPTVSYIPRCLTVGIGLARDASPAKEIIAEMFAALRERGVETTAIARFATIIRKKDEPVVKALREQGYSFLFFTADELKGVATPHPSETVRRLVGTPSVSEASALKGAGVQELLIEKIKGERWTAAVARSLGTTSPDAASPVTGSGADRHGHIEIVGAGPGDPDLISVRGRMLLQRADLILYAGSLVPRELTSCARSDAKVCSSAGMTLDEQCRLMKEHYDLGELIVRLHTGDPCLYGAIAEQMAFFDKHHIDYHITPGISSFLAAAAELRSELTIPGKTQTVILTRGEGRTAMPRRETLRLLARSRSTMCIFLSAAIAREVQDELMREYPAETPVAVCYRLTWRDQALYRGYLKDLARIISDNHLTLTTMIIVGDAIDNRRGSSKLYDSTFSHLFRQ